jgi:signal peptidase II
MKIGSVLGIDLFWTLTYNPGAAWGVFGSFPTVLLLFRILFILLLFAIIVLAQISPLSKMVLAAILGGACSNIIDTIMWGHVVDMIHLRLWGWDYPVFNVADMGICIGSAALFVLMVLTSNKESPSKQ